MNKGKTMPTIIADIKKIPEEALREFLYLAIFVPEGEKAPEKSIIDLPELLLYIENFGKKRGDIAVAAVSENEFVGLAWARIMHDYGHIGDETPSLAIAIREEYRGMGIGEKMLRTLLRLLLEKGYPGLSLSVQKENKRAFALYQKLGFEIVREDAEEAIMLFRLNR